MRFPAVAHAALLLCIFKVTDEDLQLDILLQAYLQTRLAETVTEQTQRASRAQDAQAVGAQVRLDAQYMSQ